MRTAGSAAPRAAAALAGPVAAGDARRAKRSVDAAACCARKDCTGVANLGCYYFGKGSDRLRACSQLGQPGSKAVGEACSSNSECQTRICLMGSNAGTCTDTCCHDSDCGEPTKVGCRPTGISGIGTLLLCVPLQ